MRKKVIKRKHRKDFHWKQKNKNPFHIPDEPSEFRQKILYTIGVFSVLVTLFLVLYHPFFQIKTIHISGIERINKDEFLASTKSIVTGNKYIMIPRKNYFFFDTEELAQILKDKYILEDISIITEFPDIMHIAIQEKISTIIYDDGSMYSYMTIDGKIVEQIKKVSESEWQEQYSITTSTLADGTNTTTRKLVSRLHRPPYKKIRTEMGEYPIIYDIAPEDGNLQYTAEEINTILSVQNLLQDTYNLSINYIITEDDRNVRYKTNSGTDITISLEHSIDEYIQILKEISFTVDVRDKNEIDLRYGKRVYIR